MTVGEGDDADQVKRVFTDLSPSEVSQLATLETHRYLDRECSPPSVHVEETYHPEDMSFNTPLRGAYPVASEFGIRTKNDGSGRGYTKELTLLLETNHYILPLKAGFI